MKKLLLAVLISALSLSAHAQVVPFGTLGGSGSSTAAGSPVVGCTAYSIVTINSAGNLTCDPTAVVNGSVSIAARSILSISDTISGSSATSNWYNLTGTMPVTLSADTSAALISITGDNDAQNQYGLNVSLAGAASTGITAFSSAIRATVSGSALNAAGWFETTNSGTIQHALVGRYAGAATRGVGMFGIAVSSSNGYGGVFIGGATGNSYGAFGAADSDATNAIGVYGFAGSSPPTINSILSPAFKAGVVADNSSAAIDILIATDNTTAVSNSAAWAGTRVIDGGQAQCGNCVLTSSTMTATNVAEMRTVTSSYAWTNAMVVALGAALTGDINVVTLPAKTRIDKALLVIDTAAAGPTTLTVSCGDAGGGTPFINYIVPSDAKAAANTVYGDLASGAETGTSLFDATAKWVGNYIPSYTTTTLVTCHFIATVANLNTVTTSTGRLILTTTLLP